MAQLKRSWQYCHSGIVESLWKTLVLHEIGSTLMITPVRYLPTTSLIGLTNLHLWKIPHCKTADKSRLHKGCFSLKPQHLIIKTFTRGHLHVLCTERRRSPLNVHRTKRPIWLIARGAIPDDQFLALVDGLSYLIALYVCDRSWIWGLHFSNGEEFFHRSVLPGRWWITVSIQIRGVFKTFFECVGTRLSIAKSFQRPLLHCQRKRF